MYILMLFCLYHPCLHKPLFALQTAIPTGHPVGRNSDRSVDPRLMATKVLQQIPNKAKKASGRAWHTRMHANLRMLSKTVGIEAMISNTGVENTFGKIKPTRTDYAIVKSFLLNWNEVLKSCRSVYIHGIVFTLVIPIVIEYIHGRCFAATSSWQFCQSGSTSIVFQHLIVVEVAGNINGFQVGKHEDYHDEYLGHLCQDSI